MEPNKINKNEKIICLMNNWDIELEDDYSLVNGIIGYVEDFKIVNQELSLGTLDFKPDFLDETTADIIFDNTIFETNEFKYPFH